MSFFRAPAIQECADARTHIAQGVFAIVANQDRVMARDAFPLKQIALSLSRPALTSGFVNTNAVPFALPDSTTSFRPPALFVLPIYPNLLASQHNEGLRGYCQIKYRVFGRCPGSW